MTGYSKKQITLQGELVQISTDGNFWVTVDDNADTLYIYDFTNNSARKVTHHSTNNIEPVNRYSAYEEKNNDYAIIVKDDEVDVYVSFGSKVQMVVYERDDKQIDHVEEINISEGSFKIRCTSNGKLFGSALSGGTPIIYDVNDNITISIPLFTGHHFRQMECFDTRHFFPFFVNSNTFNILKLYGNMQLWYPLGTIASKSGNSLYSFNSHNTVDLVYIVSDQTSTQNHLYVTYSSTEIHHSIAQYDHAFYVSDGSNVLIGTDQNNITVYSKDITQVVSVFTGNYQQVQKHTYNNTESLCVYDGNIVSIWNQFLLEQMDSVQVGADMMVCCRKHDNIIYHDNHTIYVRQKLQHSDDNSNNSPNNDEFDPLILIIVCCSVILLVIVVVVGCLMCRKYRQVNVEIQQDDMLDSTNVQIQDKTNNPCTICLSYGCEEYLPCGHIFHAACVTAWLHKNGDCPLCRKKANIRHLRKI